MKGIKKQGRQGIGRDLFWGLLLLSLLAGMILLSGCQPAEKPSVEISEVVSSNAQSYVREEYGALDWIELHNTGTKPVSLNGWFLTDKYGSLDADCCLPNITLPPDGYCVVFADKEMASAGSLCLPFGLSKNGETLYLFNADGEQMDQLSVPALKKDVSWAKGPDGAFGYCLLPTPEHPNDGEILAEMPAAEEESLQDETFRGDGPLEISEVVSSNGMSLVESPYGAVDWIELHNRSGAELSLKGWFLSDKDALTDASCALPAVTVPADGYFVILADTEGAKKGDRCLPFSIRKTGETLHLFDPSGQRVAALTVPALEKDVSWALDETGAYGYCLYPTPGKANTTEIVHELPTTPAEGKQPSAQRSQTELRINEVCSVSGTDRTDWIELYNPTDQALDATGFYLSDSASNAVKAKLPALTVPARGYLVVPLGPAADPAQGITAFSLSSAGEPLYLYDGELGLVDMLEVPPLQEGLVYARRDDGTFGYCGVPTPGAANNERAIQAEPFRTMAPSSPIHISEGLFRNRYSVIDAYGDRSDWVELVNRSKSICSLAGYYLSDDRNDLTKWPLPDRELAPGEYLLVFLSGRESTAEELHASFSVSGKDEGCFLYRLEGLEAELLPYPKDLPENVSLGLGDDGDLIYFAYPTPGYANARSFSGALPTSAFPAGDVFISEVSAGGDNGDWVELYNRSDAAVKLTGWHLSDDADSPGKKSLDDVSIKPAGYAVVYLNKKGGSALFSIALSGEELVLSDENGAVRDVFSSGVLQKGYTSGRVEAAPEQGRVFFEAPTPAKRNGPYRQGYAAVPRFSDTDLYRDGSFALTLQAGSAGTEIHYTLDGSKPTALSPLYREPLTISKNTTVRAIGVAAGCFDSQEAVATYLFRKPHTLPVVCIAAEPDRWAQLTRAPFQEAGLKEQAAWLNYYEADGTLGTAFPAGISPRGNASLGYPQKSLSVHLRGTYGQSTVSYPFWGADSFLSYRFLVLRNGSQDIRSARLRDSFANRAAENLRVLKSRTRPVIAYVNGTYYGIMDLNEGMNHDYLRTHFGVDQDKVNMVQRNDHVKRGSAEGFVALRRFASRKNMADDAVYAELCQKMDVDVFIDYLIAQSFFGNYDIHNQNWWGTTDGTLRWQPMLYDVDRCLNETSAASNVLGMYFNSAGIVHNKVGDRIYMEIPCGLKKNAAWRQRFVERYAEVLCTEFSEERLLGLLDEMADALRPEMAEHVALWNMPDSVSVWEKNIKQMRQCIQKRYAKVIGQIKSQFSLSDAEWDALMKKYSGN